jgi:large subunit ribosomal protein L22
MEVKSISRYVRISAFKVREVTRQIQGLPVTDALDILRFTPKKAAVVVQRTLKSAVANAENNCNLRVDQLVIKQAVAGEGMTIKRYMPRARGSASPIRKRTSHISIVLTDELPILRREKNKNSGKKSKQTRVSVSGGSPAPQVASAPAAADQAAEVQQTPATSAAPSTETAAAPAAESSSETSKS